MYLKVHTVKPTVLAWIHSWGIGDEKALKVLEKVHNTFGVPTVTDIHAADEAAMAADYVDILQIPAFLCRQTDLLVAAAQTGKTINIKRTVPLSACHAVCSRQGDRGRQQERYAD